MVKRQLSYWSHGTGRWLWWLLVTAPLSIPSAFLIIRDAVLPIRFRNIYLLEFLPSARVYWYWYVIFALAYVIVVMLLVAPAANRVTIRKLKERHRESFRRYREREGVPSADYDTVSPIRSITKTVTLEPNIQPLNPQLIDAHNQDDGVIVEGELVERVDTFWREGSKNLGALVLPFQNRIPEGKGKDVGTADYISARLKYRHYHSGKSEEINRGAWLSEEHHRVYFGLGDTRKLIIVTLEGSDDEPGIYAVSRDSVGTRRGVETHRRKLTLSGVFGVAIELIDEAVGNVIRKWDFILEIEWKPEFKLELTEIRLWKTTHLSRLWDEGFKFEKELFEISKAIHENAKFEAHNFVSPHDWQSALRAAEQEREGEMIDAIKDWETRTGAFLGLYMGREEQKNFLGLLPSIDQGFQRASKGRYHFGSPVSAANQSPNWTLGDAITGRVEELQRLRTSVLR